jgi:hypothetical protein
MNAKLTWKITMHKRNEMLDLVIVRWKARGIIARDLVTGEIEDIQHTQLLSPEDTETFSSPMRWVLTLLQRGKYIKRSLLILLYTNSPNLYPSIWDHQAKLTLTESLVMTDVFSSCKIRGCKSDSWRKIKTNSNCWSRPWLFRKKISCIWKSCSWRCSRASKERWCGLWG